jgi:manganese transport protein
MRATWRCSGPGSSRRLPTWIPAAISSPNIQGGAILAARVNPTSALVLRQVVLSFGIPFALVPLVMLTSRRDLMGRHANRRRTAIAGWACAAVITALNVLLLGQQFFGR